MRGAVASAVSAMAWLDGRVSVRYMFAGAQAEVARDNEHERRNDAVHDDGK